MPAKKTATKRKPQKLPFGGLGQDPALAKAVSAPVSTKRGLGRVLTAQQLKFVHELVAGEGKVTKKEAAIRAGIPEEKATYTAALYLQSGAVLKAIQDLRKLQEIKSMYRTGGQPIEDIQENTLLIEEDDGHDTGSEVIQETAGEPDTGESDTPGIEGEPGDTGLFGGFTFDEDVDNVGAEGRKAWPLGKP
jgi:hypothetical protein